MNDSVQPVSILLLKHSSNSTSIKTWREREKSPHFSPNENETSLCVQDDHLNLFYIPLPPLGCCCCWVKFLVSNIPVSGDQAAVSAAAAAEGGAQ